MKNLAIVWGQPHQLSFNISFNIFVLYSLTYFILRFHLLLQNCLNILFHSIILVWMPKIRANPRENLSRTVPVKCASWCLSLCQGFLNSSLRKQPTFREVETWALAKRRLSNERRNSILMTRHYPDLGSASDWLKRSSRAFSWKFKSQKILGKRISLADCPSLFWFSELRMITQAYFKL